MIKKYDTTLMGLILALVLPIITYLILFLAKAHHLSFSEFTYLVFNNASYRVDVLTMCVLPNMFLFYFVNFRFHMNKFTKGLVIISILIGLTIVFSSI
ncbi:MAG: hypothetical protein ABI207_01905 [Crocinitomicaceae bacterium]